MTTTANKHGLKAAAKEKSKKHAQRTPLPPKKEKAAEIKELAQEINAPAQISTDGKSSPKATAFIAEIAKSGWTASIVKSGDHIEVTATRDPEVIFIEWTGGVFIDSATYSISDRSVKLRNASAAKKYAARSPEEGQAELQRVATNKSFRKRPLDEEAIVKFILPFDVELATDAEVISALQGRAVRWVNRFRSVQETATVTRDARKIHITEFAGERIVNFLCPITGFRSARLVALTRVGRLSATALKGLTKGSTGPVELEIEDDPSINPVAPRKVKRK